MHNQHKYVHNLFSICRAKGIIIYSQPFLCWLPTGGELALIFHLCATQTEWPASICLEGKWQSWMCDYLHQMSQGCHW